MDTTGTVSLLWAGFIATHLGLASRRVEPALRARLSDVGFLGLYSLVALAFFVPLVWVYLGGRHDGGWLWVVETGPVLRGVLYAAMTVALAMLVTGAALPGPASVAPGAARVTGAYRITRHPLVLGTGVLMLLHVLPNGSRADLAFFGGFVVFTLLGAWHQDARKLASGDETFRRFYDETRFWPFSGSGSLRGLLEIPAWIWAVSIAGTLGIRWLHPLGIWPH